MSKKNKRQARKVTVGSKEISPAVSTTGPITSRPQATGQSNFNPDYSYVIKDLRRIGILAGTFISILVILSFFLR